jgi:hypothetical protein
MIPDDWKRWVSLCQFPYGMALPFRTAPKDFAALPRRREPQKIRIVVGKPKAFRKGSGKAAMRSR